jgi:glycosyltransferase involved in cell wall biosynthesis
MAKIRVLAHGDYVANTGFGTVMRNIIKNLHDTGDFEIEVVGINYDGDPYDTDMWKGRVYPALKSSAAEKVYMDVFGRQRVLDLLAANVYEVLFIIQDSFVVKEYADALMETAKNVDTKVVFYYPIDATPHPSWITEVVSKVHYPITYTNYAFNESVRFDPKLKDRLEVIYHGTNISEFYPVEPSKALEFRKRFFGANSDKYILMNLNRNQPRKDILRSLLIQKELKDRDADTLLYMHMQGNDVGGDIKEMADQLGLVYGTDYLFPTNIGNGYPVEILNELYNAVDCVLTTTHGEGWGLSVTEAMATKTPVVAPDVTSLSEMLADGRGVLIPSGDTTGDWYTLGHGDNNRLRPLMNVQAAADAVQGLQDGHLPDVEGAYTWAISQDWSVIAKQFEKIIRKAAERPKVQLNREQRRKLAKVKK